MSVPNSTDSLVADTRRLTIAVVAVIVAGFGFAMLQRGLLMATADSVGSPAGLVMFDLRNWGLWLVLCPVTVVAARRWPLKTSPGPDLARHVGAAIVLALVHTTLLSLLNGTAGRDSVIASAAGLLTWRLAFDASVYATMVSVVLVVDARIRAQARERAALRATAESAQARLAALELQIQPHFLFNTMNTAAMLARTGRAEEAATVITQLSALLRELVNERPGETVALRQELAFVSRYLEIERTRFGARLQPTIEATPDAMSVAVPRLLLQPLVENAVRHGLSHSPTSGVIEVRARLEQPDILLVTISDDGPGPAPVANGSSGIGLTNTTSRLKALFGDRSSLTTMARPDGGMLVTLRLPVAT